ncbi:hypothetical protein ELE36_03015 [Pseudolysobacter antarcticus]|uniref:CSLREA domain-containing protein n=1 Tax=Pseudolysobacter antarcticus TaxID=2511995 RepID=A0A411HG23_9GAMM|nr:choice-of-anchor Q domain-containing protein [Pseudolysobacter antarcticus]QBB69429.1 hypothetical protein ELE36_03015 [Pseudolysobacter antarcticus]
MVSSTANSGVGTLRQVILNAAPGDTIVFNLNYPTVIPVTGSELTINKSLTIVGPGPDDLWLDGMSSDTTIFNVLAGATVDISQLGIRNSRGIRNAGVLTLSYVAFQDNLTGGAILNTAKLAVSDSIFQGNRSPASNANGGAIYNVNNAVIDRCTFVDNQSKNGGAIANNGNMAVNASTFSGNQSSDTFGGAGGAIRNNGVLTLTNSTLSGNSANGSGGAIHNHTIAVLTIAGSTIIDNTAATSTASNAIFRYGAVSISRSIIAGSCGGGALASTGDNLGTDGTCVPNSAPLNDGNHSNLTLDPLAQNGGPTQTRLLPIGSPAIDAVLVNTADCTGTDQRGVPRPNGNFCDIGAVEMELDSVFVDGFE